jgi:hypothetical protein
MVRGPREKGRDRKLKKLRWRAAARAEKKIDIDRLSA